MREEQKRKKDRGQAYKRNAAREFGEMQGHQSQLNEYKYNSTHKYN